MQLNNPNLFIEFGKLEFSFIVFEEKENNLIEIVYKNFVPVEGIENNRISDLNLVYDLIKKNIFLVEQKTGFIFKEVDIIINNFECSLINFSGIGCGRFFCCNFFFLLLYASYTSSGCIYLIILIAWCVSIFYIDDEHN